MVLALASGPQQGLSPLAKRGCGPGGPCEGELAFRLGDVSKVNQEEPEVEPNGLGAGKAPRQGPEARKRRGGLVLVVQADRGGGQRFGVSRRPAWRGGGLPPRRRRAQ